VREEKVELLHSTPLRKKKNDPLERGRSLRGESERVRRRRHGFYSGNKKKVLGSDRCSNLARPAAEKKTEKGGKKLDSRAINPRLHTLEEP